MGKRKRKGAIQNEEVLLEVLFGGTFFIPCLDKKDAHSKSVSLNNAKNSRLSDMQQRKIKIQEMQLDGEWGVKVYPASNHTVWKIVDGEKVKWNPDEDQSTIAAMLSPRADGQLSADSQHILETMIKDKKSPEDILDILSDEKQEVVLEEISKYIDKCSQPERAGMKVI